MRASFSFRTVLARCSDNHSRNESLSEMIGSTVGGFRIIPSTDRSTVLLVEVDAVWGAQRRVGCANQSVLQNLEAGLLA